MVYCSAPDTRAEGSALPFKKPGSPSKTMTQTGPAAANRDSKPLSNIEIAQGAKMRRISEIAQDRLGIPEDRL